MSNQETAVFCALSAQETAERLKTDTHAGLKPSEAAARLRKYGRNRIEKKKKKSFLHRFALQFGDFMVLTLLVASAVSFGVSAINGEVDFAEPLLILGIVFANALIGTVQEAKAERALDALDSMTQGKSTAIRGGKTETVLNEELVPGDLVRLRTGDIVPADIRLIDAVRLSAEESALTGESVPTEKSAAALCPKDTQPAEQKCMVFSGTGIAEGHGLGIVTATGMQTQMGRIAAMLGGEEAPETPLKQRLHRTGKRIGLVVVAICAVVFLIGLLQQKPPLEMFMIAISLAVAAIPEGLPAVVTIVLALGVRRMAAKKAIIRNLQAVETLGSCEIICSDKTGTLTQNKMAVVRVCTAEGVAEDAEKAGILRAAALCTTVETEGTALVGAPTETAIAAAVSNVGELFGTRRKRAEFPFSSTRKRMTVVLEAENGVRVITKGAPDLLLARCSTVRLEGKTVPLTPERRSRVLALNTEMAGDALRVLAVAEKHAESVPQSEDAAETGLCFLGLLGLEDPPRVEAEAAVKECISAGIRPVMITGDQPVTASAIAERLGINAKTVMTGAQLDRMDDTKLLDAVKTCSVFARVSPEHKLRIVKAFRKQGKITAMTGDGVNDAPALKAADIGCAMGKNGTEVAKGAADMVLTDDNFASIVSAVREGRTVYRNIQKTVHFLMSCNIGEILLVLSAFLLHTPAPLLPAQLLWVNLVTDALPALALGSDPAADDVMRQPPTPKEDTVFSKGVRWVMLIEGMMIGALALAAFSIGRVFFDADPMEPVIGRTMAFAVLSLSQLVHSFNMRSAGPVFGRGMLKNRFLDLAFLICSGLMVAVIAISPLAKVFNSVPLGFDAWAVTALLFLVPLILCEAEKRLAERKNTAKRRHIFRKTDKESLRET